MSSDVINDLPESGSGGRLTHWTLLALILVLAVTIVAFGVSIKNPMAKAVSQLPEQVVKKCFHEAPMRREQQAAEIDAEVGRGELRGKFAGFARIQNTLEFAKDGCLQDAAIALDPSLARPNR